MAHQLMMRGFWGPRPEGEEGVTERLSAFCKRLGDLFPGEMAEWLDASEIGVRLEDVDEARAFVQQCFSKLSDTETELGVVLVASASPANGVKLTFNAIAGGFSQLATLKNNIVLKLDLPPGIAEHDRVTIARNCFDVLLEEWEPDWGDLTSRVLWDAIRSAVQIKSRTPRAGYVTYLSAGRKAEIPTELMPQSTETADGGILIGDTADGSFLPPARIADIDNSLRATPAFEPLPTDRSRL